MLISVLDLSNLRGNASDDHCEVNQAVLTRWKRSNPNTWKKNIAKKRRSDGLSYQNKQKLQPAKQPKPVNCEKCRFKCNKNFSEDNRRLLCSTFWAMADFVRQKDFILSNVTSSIPKRRRPRKGYSPRQNCKQYYLTNKENKHRVCQGFFLKTLSISNVVVYNAFKHKGNNNVYMGADNRGKREPGNKTTSKIVMAVKRHIESFPTTPSHYSRKSTQKIYLDSKLSIAKMFSLYKEQSEKENEDACSFITYKRIFGNFYNLSFFKPRKDLCQTCENYRNATEKEKFEEIYQKHDERKRDCYAAKIRDKERASREQQFQCVTFDLQSVLQIPCSDISPMYYSRKICVYNLTFYESAPPNDAFCFCWTELNGKRGSSEIGTCLFHYLNNLPAYVMEISLWSDTCAGQNRNKHIAALLLYAVQVTHLKVIEHKFLESGHSYMEADSMHSAIEKAKKFVPVYTVQDWLSIFRVARSKRNKNSTSGPYKVNEMKFIDFYDLKQLSSILIANKSKDTLGQNVNWLLIKSLKYTKENPGILYFKYHHSAEYRTIHLYSKGRPQALPKQLKKLYKDNLPISVKKKNDLLKLCKSLAIPEEFHLWYKSLPTSTTVKDATLEPSVEDSGTDDDSENEVTINRSEEESDDSDDNMPLSSYVTRK